MAKNQTTRRIEEKLEEHRTELAGIQSQLASDQRVQSRIAGKIEALEEILSDESPED